MTANDFGAGAGPGNGTGTPPQGAPSAGPDGVIRYLAAASAWIRFMAVLGFISIGIMVLAGLVLLVTGVPYGAMNGRMFGLMYLVLGLIYLLIVVPLNRCASAAGRLKVEPDRAIAVEALRHQLSFWRRMGILTIVSIAISILMMLSLPGFWLMSR